MRPQLSILIVSYRTKDAILACLRSIYEQTHEGTFEVVVVDNGSGDGTASAVAETFPAVRLVPLDTNLGYARAVNHAASLAQGSNLMLLNPDTVILNGALDRLLAFSIANPRAGIYTGRTQTPDGRPDPRSCWGPVSLWSLTCFGFGLSTLLATSPLFNPEAIPGWPRDSVREVGVVTGCLCLIRREVWDELGGFDPAFFMYGEDMDLGMRAASRGYRPLLTPDAAVVHEVGASSATDLDKAVLLMQGKVTLVRRHWHGPGRRWGLMMLRLGVAIRAAGSPRRSTWRELWHSRKRWAHGYEISNPAESNSG